MTAILINPQPKDFMKTLRYWLANFTTDGLLFALLYFWKIQGDDGAGNALIAVLWFFIVVRVLAGFSCNKTSFESNPRPAGFRYYNQISEAVFFVALSYYGLFVTAAFLYFSHFLMEAARSRAPKTTD